MIDSAVFPWFADLNQAERRQFHVDLIAVSAQCVTRGDWAAFDELLEDWQATAGANRTPGLLDVWERRGRAEDYEPMEIPRAERPLIIVSATHPINGLNWLCDG